MQSMQSKFNIVIKSIDEKTLHLTVSPSETIKSIKTKIMNQMCLPIEEQALLFGGKIMKDFNTLEYYGVEDNGIITLMKLLLKDDSLQQKKNEIPIYNPKFRLLPTIILNIEYDCTINEILYNNLKKELSEIVGNNNFSIIELRKGSIIMKIVLLGDLALKGIKASEFNKTSEEINTVLKKIESAKFVCLGKNGSSNTSYNIPDYSKDENRIKLIEFLKESCKNNDDIFQSTSTMTNKEFDMILEKTMKYVADIAFTQEINQKKYILNKLEDFNNQIESIIEQSKKESIFEFGVAGLSLIDRDTSNYQNLKSECKNMVTKFLFHGTTTNASSLITTGNFKDSTTAFFGPGIYMTDMLDYSGFYACKENAQSKFENLNIIRKKDELFSIVVSQVFYDKLKFEKCYELTDESIPPNGIRYVNVNSYGQPLSKNQTKEKGYKKFIGSEYVIPSQDQILPLYSITLKRNEYYCLWKDYHFSHQTQFTEHAIHVKNMAKQLLGINVYGVGEFDEALDIIRRKKYNKVIIISNVGIVDKAKQFIEDIRKILKFNVVILFFTASLGHLEWIKEIPNVLFTIDDCFFKEYILNFNESGLNNLKVKIEEEYGQKLNKFHADLSYPLFKQAEEESKYSSINMD